MGFKRVLFTTGGMMWFLMFRALLLVGSIWTWWAGIGGGFRSVEYSPKGVKLHYDRSVFDKEIPASRIKSVHLWKRREKQYYIQVITVENGHYQSKTDDWSWNEEGFRREFEKLLKTIAINP